MKCINCLQNELGMKKLAFVFIVFLSINQLAYTQGNKDKIEVQQTFGGTNFSIDGQRITKKQMMKLMQNEESAYIQIKSGKKHSTAATVVGAAGGFLIGFNVAAAMVNGRATSNNGVKWGMAIAGGVLVIISIPLAITGTNRTIKAINIYNENLDSQSFQKIKPDFRICFTGSGIGLIIKI